jgi:uncharacterized protein (DUF2141 family)
VKTASEPLSGQEKMRATRRKLIMVTISLLLTWHSVPAAAKAGSGADPKGTIMVKLAGIRSSQGAILISLVNSAESFSENIVENYYKTIKVKIADPENVVALFEVPYGEYAIKLYQDENNNQRLDKWLFTGIPREPYGFSHNVRAYFGPPSYDQARFMVAGEQTSLSIELR